MGYSLEPFKYEDGSCSSTVFYLSKDGKDPLQEYFGNTGDEVASAKMARAIQSVDSRGIKSAQATQLLRKLKGGKNDKDLWEIRTNSCTARAFSFLVDEEEIVVIAFVDKVHSGAGKKDTQKGVKRLNKMRPNLEKALKERKGNGQAV